MSESLETMTFPWKGRAVEIAELFAGGQHAFLLESSLQDPQRGRYSFIGVDPFTVFTANGPRALDHLRKEFSKYGRRSGTAKGSPTPFPSGIMGYLSYDWGLSLEKTTERLARPRIVPDCLFGFYDCVITVDHLKGQLIVCSSGRPEKNAARRRRRARQRLKEVSGPIAGFLANRRENPWGAAPQDFPKTQLNLKSNFTRRQYVAAVRKALEYIRRGDIYQVNLSQRFRVDGGQRRVQPMVLYRLLRDLSPSCFGGYFDTGDFQIISSSPELFLRLRGKTAETRPMKGTRPRGETPRQDQAREKDLQQSGKDRAELLMITDLERNDLGRVCRYGSVRVKELRTLEKYRTVFQSTSTVAGTLRDDRDGFDLIRACYPGGSITGCPKIRAMQIIDELERTPRGIYTGTFGYMSFDGDMDFNILIRTLMVKGAKIYFHAGGGIVTDSTPDGEYEETLVKASAMKECLQKALGA